MSASTSSSPFILTKRLKESINLINILDISKFSQLITKILIKLHNKNISPFTNTEYSTLVDILNIKHNELSIIIDVISYIFETAAYRNIKDLKDLLLNINMNEEKAEIFNSIWLEKGNSFIILLREHTIGSDALETIDWRLHLKMSNSNLYKEQELKSIFNLKTNNNNITIEFTEEELLKFYNQLETVQEQLDSLT